MMETHILYHDTEKCDCEINHIPKTPIEKEMWECSGCGEVFTTSPWTKKEMYIEIDRDKPDYPSFESGYHS